MLLYRKEYESFKAASGRFWILGKKEGQKEKAHHTAYEQTGYTLGSEEEESKEQILFLLSLVHFFNFFFLNRL